MGRDGHNITRCDDQLWSNLAENDRNLLKKQFLSSAFQKNNDYNMFETII